jgi:hypothetical protein
MSAPSDRVSLPDLRLTSLAVALVIGALLGVGFLLSREDQISGHRGGQVPSEVDNPVQRLFDTEQPLLPGGTMVMPDRVPAFTGYAIYVPRELPPGAEQEDAEFWVYPGSTESGIRYASQLVLTFREWGSAQEPATEYAQQAQDWAAGTATTIGGHSAWVIPAGSHAPGEPPTSVVHISREALDVTLYGQMPIDDLVAVAASLERMQASSKFAPGGDA